MIERWWQFTCDRCEETFYSTAPNMTVREFAAMDRFRRRRGIDLCQECVRATRGPIGGGA